MLSFFGWAVKDINEFFKLGLRGKEKCSTRCHLVKRMVGHLEVKQYDQCRA